MSIKVPVNQGDRPIKSSTFGNFKGVDLTSSPFDVNTSRAIKISNIINDNGINHKRQGWTEKLAINMANKDGKNPSQNEKNTLTVNNVSGIFEFIDVENNRYKILFYNNGKGFIYNSENEEIYNFKYVNIPDDHIIRNFNIIGKQIENYFVYYYDDGLNTSDKEWSYGYIEYGLYDGRYLFINNSNKTSLFYVPETTISINPDSEETSTIAKKDSINLLSKKIKNGLITKKVPDNSYVTLTLKANPELNSKFSSLYIYDKIGNVDVNYTEEVINLNILRLKVMSSTYKISCSLLNNDNDAILYYENGEKILDSDNIAISENTTIIAKNKE